MLSSSLTARQERQCHNLAPETANLVSSSTRSATVLTPVRENFDFGPHRLTPNIIAIL